MPRSTRYVLLPTGTMSLSNGPQMLTDLEETNSHEIEEVVEEIILVEVDIEVELGVDMQVEAEVEVDMEEVEEVL